MKRSNLQIKYFETRTPESLKTKNKKNTENRKEILVVDCKKRTQNFLQEPKNIIHC